MADKKISQLANATTPLAGTEVLPIVQSSTTVKVAANDLTVKNVRSNATTGILQVTGPAAASTRVMTVPDANFTAARTDAAQTFTGTQTFSSNPVLDAGTASSVVYLDASKAATSGSSLTFNGSTFRVNVADGALLALINGATRAVRIGANATGVNIEGVDNTGVAAFQPLTVGGADVRFSITGSEKMRLTSAANLSLGGTADRGTTVGTNALNIFNGTAPVGTLTNGVSFYSASGEAYVMDATGNATLISPHDAQTNEWIFKSKHTPTGKVLRIDVEKLLRFVNDHFGLDAVKEFVEE